MQLIETKTLGTAQSTIEFTSIPNNFTDLMLLVSARVDSSNGTLNVRFNGSTSNYTALRLDGYGSGSAVSSSSTNPWFTFASYSSQTASTFGNCSIYIPNYTAATAKSLSSDNVDETNATEALQNLLAGRWNDTAAIDSVRFVPFSGNFVAGSTISLYGIGGAGDGYAPKATGGSINYSNGFWVHTFTSSGTFTPLVNINNMDVLVVAGGGAGGNADAGGDTFNSGGGGGAGGFRVFSGINATSSTGITVTVGAGGSAGSSSGLSSSFGTYTSAGGGLGGTMSISGASGGSGGGAGKYGAGGTGNTPSTSPSQGNNGGVRGSGTYGGGGGGGGASAAGGNSFNDSGTGGAGGAGSSSSITGTAVTYAGGGGGGAVNPGGGGAGGGGAGGSSGNSISSTPGTANTGGGGGGGDKFFGGIAGSANGGSGIVIVRYAA